MTDSQEKETEAAQDGDAAGKGRARELTRAGPGGRVRGDPAGGDSCEGDLQPSEAAGDASGEEADAEDSTSEASATAKEAAATVEAILFASDDPMTAAKIAGVAGVSQRAVKRAVGTLNQRYERMGCSFRIEAIAGGYQMLTLPEFHDVLTRLFKVRSESRLSQAALETLTIIAYRQPILRADVEAIRGVACGEVLRTLLEKSLVRIVARAEVIGRPMLYGTTKHFLEVFGLAGLGDLPRAEELRGNKDDKSSSAQQQPAAGKASQLAGQEPAAEGQEAQAPSGGEGQPAGEGSAQTQAQGGQSETDGAAAADQTAEGDDPSSEVSAHPTE